MPGLERDRAGDTVLGAVGARIIDAAEHRDRVRSGIFEFNHHRSVWRQIPVFLGRKQGHAGPGLIMSDSNGEASSHGRVRCRNLGIGCRDSGQVAAF